jgi:hypothetical protein
MKLLVLVLAPALLLLKVADDARDPVLDETSLVRDADLAIPKLPLAVVVRDGVGGAAGCASLMFLRALQGEPPPASLFTFSGDAALGPRFLRESHDVSMQHAASMMLITSS